MTAILPSAQGVFARLVDENHVGKVTMAFEEAITKSFEKHPMRHLTKSEVDRRFDLAAKIFVKLRGELKWGSIARSATCLSTSGRSSRAPIGPRTLDCVGCRKTAATRNFRQKPKKADTPWRRAPFETR